MRDQLTKTPATKIHVAARRADATSSQNSLVSRLDKESGKAPSSVHHFVSANAVSMTVTSSQAAQLAADPSVAAVFPNKKIVFPKTPADSTTQSAVTPKALPEPTDTTTCGTAAKPLLEPEALQDTNTASDDPTAKTAQQLTTGAGVKVAYIADAIDPDSPDFIRADGSHVITDYKAFSADGATTDDGGEEAFGDASSIAAQGLVAHDLSTYVNPAYPLPAGCDIRILGMAPGASIVALKTDFYDTSILQAIDYAVSTDHVDVLNESFGGNVIPDAGSRAVVQMFNDMAVAAGTTVTVSSGDAGTTGTIGSPAADPQVISVGASTNNRTYLQTNYAFAKSFGNGKWINDNISSLSSGGVTQAGGTVDLVAPGESGWAVCDHRSSECVNFNGQGSDFDPFGGTSESAPLTAGAAALVISAYRSTHGGASPTPAVVKQLLTSTATDLGVPTFEQGSGLLDARAAVEAALTYPGATTAAPDGVSSNIALTKSQFDISGAPGSSQTVPVGITNVGTKPLTVATSTRDFSTVGAQTQQVPIDASSTQTMPYPTNGAPWVYTKATFTVPAGIDRLVMAGEWQGAAKKVGTATVTPVVRFSLFNPDGTFVANSRPQGGAVSANYANLDVRRPEAGKWTAILYTVAGASGYTGNVTLQTTSQLAKSVGTVDSPSISLAPGETKTVNVGMTLPASSGDATQAITVASSDGHQVAIPVVERAVIPISNNKGTFSGTITGGNARAGSAAQTMTYAFDVPAGLNDVSAQVELADDPGIQLEAVLVDPHDETQAIDTNEYTNAADKVTGQGLGLTATALKPMAGRWRLVILVINPVTGKELDESLTGSILFNSVKVTTTVPHSINAAVKSGSSVKGTVTVTNTGLAPISVQADPRTGGLVGLPLTSPFGTQTVPVVGHGEPPFIVPPGTQQLTATSSSSIPAIVELLDSAQGLTVAGDLTAGKNGSTVSSAVLRERPATNSTGIWYVDVEPVGAVGDTPPSGSTTVGVNALTPKFDTSVTTSTGDFYAAAVDPTADTGAPVLIASGKSATISVSIKATAPVGTLQTGELYIYTPPSFAHAYYTTGDQLAYIPYTFKVTK